MPAPLFGPLSTRRYTANGVDFDMVRVPPGRFTSYEEGVIQQILLSYSFEIGVFQVGSRLWREIVFDPHGHDLPYDQIKSNPSMENLSIFCEHLSGMGIGLFRLPTTAELVWAARCGVPAAFGSSDRHGVRRVIKRQGDGLVGAAGVFDQHDGYPDTSCEGGTPVMEEVLQIPSSLIDPILRKNPVFRRWAMGGSSSRLSRRRLHGGGYGYGVIRNPYQRSHSFVSPDSTFSSFRLVRVSPSVHLEER